MNKRFLILLLLSLLLLTGCDIQTRRFRVALTGQYTNVFECGAANYEMRDDGQRLILSDCNNGIEEIECAMHCPATWVSLEADHVR